LAIAAVLFPFQHPISITRPKSGNPIDAYNELSKQWLTVHTDPTVKQAMKEDIYAIFQENMKEYTKGNIVSHVQDCFEYLEELDAPIKFCHIDASHDYMSVKKTIDMLMPHMIEGGVICGDDIKSANMKRKDLEGGVERAVRETLKGFHIIHNFYWWQK